ncbi:MAG: glycosyltransferase [Fimbriimonadales bacterium]|nr:MAG: hypothetical protein KatS3mg018_0210 [Fimbriimonadales bacterium]
MKVAVVGGFPPNREGEAHYTGCVFRAFATQYPQAHVRVIAHRQPDAPDASSFASNGDIVRATDGYHRWRRHLTPLQVYRSLRAYAPDVVHFQAPHKGLYGGLYGEPLLWVFRWLRRKRIPTVVTLHSLWLEEDFREMASERRLSESKRRALQRLYRRYHWQLFRAATQVNALVAGDQNPLIQEFQELWGLTPFCIENEAHPCEPRAYTREQSQRAKESLGFVHRKLVLAFGFVRPDKGFHYLMEAAGALIGAVPTLQLLIAGEPRGGQGQAYAQQLQARYEQMGCPDQIRLHLNYLSDDALEQLLLAADVLVVPYTRVMGASGPVHHALSLGKPVVATAIGQNRGLAEVCWLVPPHDASALAAALQQLLTDDARWDDYHRRARDYAATHTWRHLATQYYQDYQRLLERVR